MILLGSEIKEFNNYKIFLENHYRDLSINKDRLYYFIFN